MKSKLIRLFAVVASVLVLAVVIVVPAAADYSPETGWDAPVGVVDGPLEIVVDVGSHDSTFEFVGYKVVVDIDTLVSNTKLYDNSSGYCFVYLGPDYGYEQISSLTVRDGTLSVVLYGLAGNMSKNYSELVFYIEDYPTELLNQASSAWRYVDFEVYEVSVPSVIEPIGNVFTGIMNWVTSALTSVMGVFYVDGSLTLLGTLAVIGVAIAVAFLLIGVLQRFLHLRG